MRKQDGQGGREGGCQHSESCISAWQAWYCKPGKGRYLPLACLRDALFPLLLLLLFLHTERSAETVSRSVSRSLGWIECAVAGSGSACACSRVRVKMALQYCSCGLIINLIHCKKVGNPVDEAIVRDHRHSHSHSQVRRSQDDLSRS